MSKQYVRIPVSVICDTSISPAARVIFGALVAVGGRRASQGRQFEAPLDWLEQILGRCGWSLTRRIHELERRGHLHVHRPKGGQLNKYRLIVR